MKLPFKQKWKNGLFTFLVTYFVVFTIYLLLEPNLTEHGNLLWILLVLPLVAPIAAGYAAGRGELKKLLFAVFLTLMLVLVVTATYDYVNNAGSELQGVGTVMLFILVFIPLSVGSIIGIPLGSRLTRGTDGSGVTAD